MKTISIFNPTILSPNIGDDIILDSIYNELYELFSNKFFIDIPTHELIFRNSYRTLKNSQYAFVAGTNLLSSNMFIRKQWKLTPLDMLFVKNLILLGTGWRNYEKKTNLYAKTMYKKVLHKSIIHSVRDEYTKQRLKQIGITNVLNTACPTMWKLTQEHLNGIPNRKSKNVIFTLTDYRKDYKYDKLFLKILLNNYNKVFFFTQQLGDYHYIKELGLDLTNIHFINPTLQSYDTFLNENDVDYIGTRLHGGIRALQKHKRTIIIGVDNRAIEISKDTNLLVIKREDIESLLEDKIHSNIRYKLNIPFEAIKIWKTQFINKNH